MFRRRRLRREYEERRQECFSAAMVIADLVSMRWIPDEESVKRYRDAERAFVGGWSPGQKPRR